MPFGMVSGVGRGMVNYVGVVIGSFGVEFGVSHSNGDFATWLFPNYFGQYIY